MILRCGHCRLRVRGVASVGKVKVCHPDEGMDCYRLVTVYKHWMPCRCCSEANLLLREQEILTRTILGRDITEGDGEDDGTDQRRDPGSAAGRRRHAERPENRVQPGGARPAGKRTAPARQRAAQPDPNR